MYDVADKSLIVWRLTRDESSYGNPQKSLHGHGHFVSDVILSSDGQFALSGSWDHTLRLWDLSRYELCILKGLICEIVPASVEKLTSLKW